MENREARYPSDSGDFRRREVLRERKSSSEETATTDDEVSREVEEIRERVFGPDGTTRRGERLTRRVHIERDPKPGYIRHLLSLFGRLLGTLAMAYVVVISAVSLAGSLSPWVLAPLTFSGLYLATRIWGEA